MTTRAAHSALGAELGKRTPFACPEQEAYLNLLRTHEVLAAGFDRLFREHGLTQPQYNVLRILRGHAGRGERGVSCGVISRELVTNAADVTRLVDRLVAAGLVQRDRAPGDRRVVLVGLTEKASGLLAALDGPVLDLHRAQLGHLGVERLGVLNDLLLESRAGGPGSNGVPAPPGAASGEPSDTKEGSP